MISKSDGEILPKNWITTTLDKVTYIEMGQSPDSHFYNTDKIGLPFFQGKTEFGERFPTVRKWCSEPTKIAQAGDILLSIRAPVGPTNIASTLACIGRGLAAIRAERGISQQYVFYFFRHIESWLSEQGTGTTFAAISGQFLREIPISVAPALEQTRIVEKLEELLSDLDAGVNELKVAQKKLGQYRQSLLKAAVEGELTADWRSKNQVKETGAQLLQRILKERRTRWETKQLAKYKDQNKTPPTGWKEKYPEPAKPDITNLPKIPEGWAWASVDQLSESVRNGISKTPNTEGKGFPIFKINAVRPMSVNFTAIKHIDIEESEVSDYWVEVGDVLATRYNGSVDLLGVFGMVKAVPQRTLHPDKLIRMKPLLGMQLGAWLEVSGNIGVSRSHLVSRVKTTAGQTGISGEDLKKTPVPLAPFVEQEYALAVLEERLQAFKLLETATELSLKQSNAERQIILRAAFSGQLVPQNPSEEPASILLKRIQIERGERKKQPKPIKIKTKKEIVTVTKKLLEVLTEANDWLSAQEAFHRCGIADGTETDKIEAIYAELRELDKSKQLKTKPVKDEQGRKLHDLLKLATAA